MDYLFEILVDACPKDAFSSMPVDDKLPPVMIGMLVSYKMEQQKALLLSLNEQDTEDEISCSKKRPRT